MTSFFSQLQKKDDGSSEPQSENSGDKTPLPDTLPILPLRGVVVYPNTAVPLTVGQARSIKLVDDVVAGDKLVGLVAALDPEKETPGPNELYRVGTIATVHRLLRAPDGTVRLLVQGMERFRLGEFVEEEPYLKAKIIRAPESDEKNLETDALARNARDQFQAITQMIPSFPEELASSILSLEDPLQTVYTIANFQRIELKDAQEILQIDSVYDKLKKLIGLLVREAEVLTIGQKIQNEARGEIEKVQRDYYLREQMKAIQRELGERDEQSEEIDEFRKKIEEAKMPEEADKQAKRELDRLSRLPSAAAEYGVIRTYLDTMVALPWSAGTQDNLDIAHARQVLNQDHFGLEDVKDRILEFLAIRKLRLDRANDKKEESTDLIRREREGVILCFVGPPGVGKTSLGQSIARAMGRKFIRVSLGGVRDEAEIRGHRRTYIGAMPGRILQSLRRIGTKNPVFMLDEVDKLTNDFHGDPSSALLEVLDPEQNGEFRDNYLEVAYDLSQVFFIATANTLEYIPGPLRDRMEMIYLSGYTETEKMQIARGYLIPRQIRENSLRKNEVAFNDEALKMIIRRYTREAGVRNLERKIGAVCRKVGTHIAEGKKKKYSINPKVVEDFLDNPIYLGPEELNKRTSIPGVVPGLAWTSFGGDILLVEATSMPGGRGFQITGSIGNVMQESARAALSYVRSRSNSLGIPHEYFDKHDIHMHVPAGSQPKDGPSAGVTMATSLVSLISGRKVSPQVGMTGEITLRGQVLPIGGVKEKVLAAHRSGLTTVILPKQNENDLDDVPDEIRNSMKFVFAETVEDVFKAALEKPKSKKKPTKKAAKPNIKKAKKNAKAKSAPR
ncbi:MAG: endopeptidase La [Anaerolineales bacterium]|nr:endopeptidase La [Anaerolineales bacterium]MBK9782405.1 endopeptidase La [Anaerolineales bacterium]